MSNLAEMFDLSGRAALVTGGAGLLGRQFCRTLAAAGAAVTVVDVDEKGVRTVTAELSLEGFQVQEVSCDITDSAQVNAAVTKTVNQFGSLDILVNSAALDPKFDPDKISEQGSNSFEDYPLSDWQRALDVNLTGMFLSSQAAAKVMLSQGKGVMINLSSMYGLTGPDQQLYQREGQSPQFKPAAYSVTKAGVVGFTKYLAAYFAGKNIRVNTLTPGGVFNNHDDEFVERYSARSVLGRMAAKDEMNGAILFLASDASRYMTGANLVVDGGWTAW